MTKLKLILFTLSIFIISACNRDEERALGLLQPAKGDKGEMLLVMDSAKWHGTLGEEVQKVFQQAVPGLPQPEAMFSVRYIDPLKFSGLLLQHFNIVIVTTFDSQSAGSRKLQSNFTKASLKKLNEDNSVFMLAKKDEFARGQQILHLFGKEEKTLIGNLKKNKKNLQDYFNKIERKRLTAKLAKEKGAKGIKNGLRKKHGFDFKLLPTGYRMAKDTEGFVWLRHPEAAFDKNIIVAYKDYVSEDQFNNENIIQWRNEICKEHLYGDPDKPNSYVITEKTVPVKHQKTELNQNYSIESRGLWKTNNISMGGPFLSYTLTDLNTGRLYYVEGFVYAPGLKKRELVREMEVILNSFKFELTGKPKPKK